MIAPDLFALFLAGALIVNLTPGPDMAFTLASAARGGARAGLAAAAGVGAGSLVWAAASAVGLAALLSASEQALSLIRTAGGVYLLYLAWRTFRARHAAFSSGGAATFIGAFRAGLVTNLLNPKVGIFYLAFLPGFTDASLGPVWAQIFVLGGIFSLSGILVLAAVAFGAGSIRDRLSRSERLRVRLNTTAAAVFGALGIRLLVPDSR